MRQTTSVEHRATGPRTLLVALALAAATVAATAGPAHARQLTGTENGEWRYLGGDAGHTRSSPLTQIDADNFGSLETAWIWRGDNFGPNVDYFSRSTPIYVDGMLYTVASPRRQVIAIDPATGETLWTYREPHTTRWERSMRKNYGKGVAYAEVDGRGVIYTTSPGFFLHALDARTGRPLEGFGSPVPLDGFPASGVVDMVPPLVADWGPWQEWDGPYDPDMGIPRELGYITTSSPPIVVNGVVVVGNSAEQGYNQTRIENVPGDILAYDARTGEFKWKFHVIPRPGEFGHETWENDAWRYTGDVSSWAPMSADYERGIVYIPTNPPTIDYFGGFRPGDNLFGTSVIALDVQTGERVWHFQTVHNDQWNYDIPNVPIVVDLEVDGREVPAVVQTTKTGLIFAFDRETGEPIWPIEERPAPQSDLPGEKLSPTQPHPTWPLPFEMQGLPEDYLIDFTPALRREAIEIVKDYRIDGLYTPPMQRDHPSGMLRFVNCPSGAGGSNVFGPTSSDPETGVIFVSTLRSCGAGYMVPGEELDEPDDIMTTGETIPPWLISGRRRLQGPDGLPIFKPPYSSIVAIDMNTGEHLWSVPNGDTPDQIKNHPALTGLDIPNTGRRSHAILLTTSTLLITAEGGNGAPLLHAIDKATGERVGTVEMPAQGRYGMMGYLHDGQQYIVVQISSPDHPGSLAALRLP